MVYAAVICPVGHFQGEAQVVVIGCCQADGVAVVIVDVKISFGAVRTLLAERYPVGHFFAFGLVDLIKAFQYKETGILLGRRVAVEGACAETLVGILCVGSIGDEIAGCGRSTPAYGYGEEGRATASVAHGNGLDGEFGHICIVDNIEACRQAVQTETGLQARGVVRIGQVKRTAVGAAHGKRDEQDFAFGIYVLAAFQEGGMKFQEVLFHGDSYAGNGSFATCFVELDGDEVLCFHGFAGAGIDKDGIVRHTIEFDEQAALQA